ncbi:MAG: hypothetical protein U9O86_10015, partial [Campylobacterota bacterium]|nr:hypothetical protein [Campylobacterota bacterium]
VVGNKCLDTNATLSGAEADLCLYVGLSKVSQTAVAISYIADDVQVLSDNNGSDSKLTASTCAMQYAFDGTQNTECTFGAESNVTFDGSGKTYGDINVTVDEDTFEYLISGSVNPRSTVLTNGICTLESFASRVDDENASGYDSSATYHVCPIDETNATVETTTEEILVDALNNGTDSIGAAVSDEVNEDIQEFKNEVLTANGRSINDDNTTITMEDIIKYLNKNNQD